MEYTLTKAAIAMPTFDRLTDSELLAQLRLAVASLPDVPADLQRAAVALWTTAPSTPASIARLATGVRRVVATLTFDSRAASSAVMSLRSGSVATRHWLFCAEGRDVDVRVAAHPDGWQVSGQVLGPDAAGTVRLSTLDVDEAPALETALDELGEFHFDAVAAGRRLLTLNFPDVEIVLPPIAVGDAPT